MVGAVTREVCKGEQQPFGKVITKNGEGEVSRFWLNRFEKTYSTYDPASMRNHPDYKLALKQLRETNAATGPWEYFRPKD